jgi:hypothetical protein
MGPLHLDGQDCPHPIQSNLQRQMYGGNSGTFELRKVPSQLATYLQVKDDDFLTSKQHHETGSRPHLGVR